jgi:23S rRNA pseudouridine1911/1915/1917 synthase
MSGLSDQITILHEEDAFLVIEKPAGLMVHSDGRTHDETLVDWLLEHKKVAANVGEPWTDPEGHVLPRPGIVHRLDRDTSGVLVIAKTQHMYEWLKQQFKDRTVSKSYEALVHGHVQAEGGLIDRPIGRSSSDFRKKSAQRGAAGTMRDALTEFKVLARLADGTTHVALSPKTGRTHQLRVHMKAINHPIVGDVLYGTKEDRGGAVPLMLRAVRLALPMPDGTTTEFSCKGLKL